MTRRSRGPIALTSTSHARLRPLADPYQLGQGFWSERQLLVRDRALPHALRELEQSGRFGNFRSAATGLAGYSGDTYADSDVYKTLEALAWELGREPSDSLRQAVAEAAALVGAAQADSGYLHTWFQRPDSPPPYSDMPMGHELYCAGHLVQAAIAESRSGRSELLMPIALRSADHLVRRFADAETSPVCGHPLIESALVELYRTTGSVPFLELATRMIDLRGHHALGPGPFGAAYYQDEQPVRAAAGLRGHCVRAVYLAAGAADVYLETGDASLLEALERQWSDTVATKTYLTGGVGCRRKDEAFGAPFELPPDHAFAETCAAVGSIQWSWRMLLATGKSRYADLIERLLYNLVATAMSEDGRSYSYVNTLHRRRDSLDVGDKRPSRQSWFRCPCCPPNLMRLIASLGFYVATSDDGGLQLHQYAPGSVEAELPTGPVVLSVDTDYPRSGVVDVTVVAAPQGEWRLSLRIPAWCNSYALDLHGRRIDVAADDAGYVSIRRPWSPGDCVRLDLAMPPRLTAADPRLDGVRGCLAVERGPVVYCLEQADLGDALLEDAVLDPAQPLVLEVAEASALQAIQAAGRLRATTPDGWPYAADARSGADQPLTIRLIPYHSWGNRADGPMRVWLPTS